MKLTSLLERARGSILVLLGVVSLAVSLDASAIPVFARQTGFKCIACHVGGEYPQLTSLGRMFKLTGYTMGNANDIFNLTTNIDRPPVAVMLQTARQYYTNTSSGNWGSAPSSSMDMQVYSLFYGGHITDNIGMFGQWTGTKYDGNITTGSQYTSSDSIDNTEIRYADRIVTADSDLIYGFYVNNRPTMSDVWNSTENWTSDWIGYFNGGFAASPGLGPMTVLQSGGLAQAAVGAGAYVFKDKTWYAELGIYKTPTHGPFSILTAGASGTDMDPSPYVRLAYNKEWGPHSFQVGAHGMVSNIHNSSLIGVSDWSDTVNTYRDYGIDAQYQYVLDPHYFSAHFRYTHEDMSNVVGAANFQGGTPLNSSDTLDETWADVTYNYKGKYGAMLFYRGATGSNDAGLYASSPTGSPNWQSWTPSIFWAPVQNVRIGYMYTFYTQLGGATGNVLSNGVSNTLAPHDFNTSMIYATLVY